MKVPYLSGLGVSLIDQDRIPTQAAFPHKFNPYASAIWTLVIQEVSELKNVSAAKAWTVAIQRYLDLCHSKSVYPFREQSGKNQALLDHLKACRSTIARALAAIHSTLVEYPYSSLTIDRTALLSPEGFTLTVTSTFTVPDPTFAQHLMNQGFTKSGLRLVRRLDSHCEVRFWFRKNRWYVSYTITGPHIPEMLDRAPAKKRLEQFIIEGLWFPLTKNERPDHSGPRFI